MQRWAGYFHYDTIKGPGSNELTHRDPKTGPEHGGQAGLVLAASKMAVVHCLVKNQPERQKPVAVSAKAVGVL